MEPGQNSGAGLHRNNHLFQFLIIHKTYNKYPSHVGRAIMLRKYKSGLGGEALP
jgi:hypothetical protein